MSGYVWKAAAVIAILLMVGVSLGTWSSDSGATETLAFGLTADPAGVAYGLTADPAGIDFGLSTEGQIFVPEAIV